MITDMDLIIGAVVGVAVLAAGGLGYLAGRMSRVSRLRRQLRDAKARAERATGDPEALMREVTTRRGHAYPTRPWAITKGDHHGHQ
ncbi:hypothetical protein F4561_006599 [Lipingzhangella halophila]|uniref:Uncharacterized protein n=1 Tax=Lipingzhangella halophila TaxID=1783352 RepID=A0A7W7RPB8_9ACTN|nr:hypothetical protein [Lipingzhangella halophila]MBB4935690.1 hypothetical protein [Lipingzhangella halophila]